MKVDIGTTDTETPEGLREWICNYRHILFRISKETHEGRIRRMARQALSEGYDPLERGESDAG